ncbi:MAG: xanthine dehydrogenase family protein molybdopterin-binding subunit [Verrucomicrobiae bacterium]|nr:xanthine dehydrogenase family protein molybdopterin-binding subunit [Verrucomicrobiae bacterium]
MNHLSITTTQKETVQGLGKPARRIDGIAKVTGRARYAADHIPPNMVHGVYAIAPIGLGTIAGIDSDAVRKIPGVLKVFTHENAPKLEPPKTFSAGGNAQQSQMILQDAEVRYHGQPVALVIAATLEAAMQGAREIKVRYEKQRAGALQLDADKANCEEHGEPVDVGDVAAGLESAAHRIDATYFSPTQHHNPMEPFTTTAAWDGPRLTVYQPSQFLVGMRNGLADVLKTDVRNIHVISPFVGGAFGSKACMTPQMVMTCAVARELGRPLKVVATREQCFTVSSFRSPARMEISLGCDSDGMLTALRAQVDEITSRFDDVSMEIAASMPRMYAWPNIEARSRLCKADCQTPGFMRAPAETPGMFGLECAMDELAEKAGIDPVEFRIRNDAKRDPALDIPFSSRLLVECLKRGAEKFGWAERPEKARSREVDGAWVGYGVASAVYPTIVSPCSVDLEYDFEGNVKVATAAHDLGTGQWTVVGQVASECLGVPLQKVAVSIGDSDLPPGALAGGSATTASLCRSIHEAAERMARQLADWSARMDEPPFGDADDGFQIRGAKLVSKSGNEAPIKDILDAAGETAIGVRGSTPAPGKGGKNLRAFARGAPALGAYQIDGHAVASWGAQFVEVRVDKHTRTIRVPRMLGVFAAGTIANPLTARSQMLGGMLWGLGSGLLEQTRVDETRGIWVNKDLAEYLVACHADSIEIDSEFLDENDQVANPLGAKGIGELGIVGVSAAIANAVSNATGIRVRELPLRLENLLEDA